MIQRKKQPDITRQAILRAAGEGFAREGYAATGIGGIAERSGLTRGALFHHFEDKRGLAVAWVREVLAQELADACGILSDHVASFADWKQACLGMLRDLNMLHPVAQLTLIGSECSEDEVLRVEVAAVVDQWVGLLSSALERGQSAGWIHRSIQPADEAVLLASQYCGMSMLLRCGDSARMMRSAERALGAYLETMRGGG